MLPEHRTNADSDLKKPYLSSKSKDNSRYNEIIAIKKNSKKKKIAIGKTGYSTATLKGTCENCVLGTHLRSFSYKISSHEYL